ncbi:hypothetical protein MVEN_00713000 [Mycena venus]|uniref:Uncharacterized protein n=1 Tax=Mycena venus TaxID=2733690 RepID=A0A8H7D2N7_9AGAR|nr:hypothetical protein MVEN_00713000 [Mycena venus]
MRVLFVLLVLPTLWAVGRAGESNALDDCQPEDLGGSALQETSLANGIMCLYPDAGPCGYFTNNGSLHPGSSLLCPAATKGFGKVISAGSDVLDDCQPEDLGGSALEKNGLVSGGFGCQYPVAGQCSYSTSLEWVIDPGRHIMSPDSYTHLYSVNRNQPNESASDEYGDRFDIREFLAVLSNTSGVSGGTTKKHGIPPGTVAGIAVSVVILLICFTVAVFWRCRRRRLQHRGPKLPYKETIAPFHIGGPRGIDDSSITRLHPQTELLTAREKMVHLQDGEKSTDAEAGGASSIHRIWRQLSARSVSPRPPPDLEAQLHTAREQIHMIAARMNALEEAHADSGLGMVRDHEAPPMYH